MYMSLRTFMNKAQPNWVTAFFRMFRYRMDKLKDNSIAKELKDVA